MPAKPGKTRRQPAAEGASAGGGETEEKTRARRGENVNSYEVTFGNHIHILPYIVFDLYLPLSSFHCQVNSRSPLPVSG